MVQHLGFGGFGTLEPEATAKIRVLKNWEATPFKFGSTQSSRAIAGRVVLGAGATCNGYFPITLPINKPAQGGSHAN